MPALFYISTKDLDMFKNVTSIPLLHRSYIEPAVSLEFAQLYVLDNLLSAQECEVLIQEASLSMAPSLVGSKDKGIIVNKEERDSDTSYLSRDSKHRTVQSVHERLIAMYGHPELTSDPMQVHRYGPSQHFSPHFDYHNVETQQARIDFEGQRTWTFIVYLNDDFEGGETHFPRLDFQIKPKRGRLVAWNNLTPTGKGNEYTQHASLPVISGEKNLLSKWFRNKVK